MKRSKLLVIVAIVMGLLLLTGCSPEPATPEAAAATARAFLQARERRDAAAVHGLLSPQTQNVLPRAEVARVLRHESVSFGGVGAPVAVQPNWVQVPVTDLVLRTAEREIRWPEIRLTLQYAENRWGVAWVDPVAANAVQAYQNSRYGDQLELARAISAMDPYHYRGPLEFHFAYRGLKRLREAELSLQRARELALPPQVADVEESYARFKLSLNRPEDAAPVARRALEAAAPYTPYLYNQRWSADTWVLLGQALLALGDRAGTENALKQAEALDPQNAAAAMLRRQLFPRP